MPKYIDADKFLQDNDYFADRDFVNPRYDDTLRDLIDGAPAADVEPNQRWIPVTERLPEKREWVLVHSKFLKMRTDFIFSDDGKWYSTPAVTHWMPLPEPPNETEETK